MGCAFNIHFIINNGLIPGGQNSNKRQTVFFLPINPRDKKGTKILKRLTWMYHVVHNTYTVHGKKHQDEVFWVDLDLAIRKGLTFYQTRSNAIILEGTLPVYCIPKVVRLKTGEVLYEKTYVSPRQRSLYVTIGQKNWVQKLIDNRKKKKLLDNHEKKLEKFFDKQNSSNQPNQTQNQSIDQDNLVSNTKCLLKKAKNPCLERSRRDLLPGPERSRRHLFTKNSVLH